MKAYTALYYLAQLQEGDTVVFTQAHTHWMMLAMQLAKACNAKVMKRAKINLSRLNIVRVMKKNKLCPELCWRTACSEKFLCMQLTIIG